MSQTPQAWEPIFERRCTRCDYDLAGHPAGPTVCPECGDAFDEELLVLRGRHGGRRRGELRTVADFARIAISLGAVMAVMSYTSDFWVMMTLFAAIALISFVVEPLLRREWGLEHAHSAKLLIRREGFWQVDTLEPMAGRRRSGWLQTIFGVVILTTFCLAVGGWKYCGVWLGLVFGLVIRAFAQRRREKIARAFAGSSAQAGEFIPWSEITRMKISPATWLRRTHILSIEFQKVTSWTRTPLVDFDWPTTPEAAWQMTTILRGLARETQSDVHGLDRIRLPR